MDKIIRILVTSEGKLIIGETGSDVFIDGFTTVTNAVEIRELLIPSADQQGFQRAINFFTLSPFDKTSHTCRFKASGIIDVEETSDTVKAYEQYLTSLRLTNSGLVIPNGTPSNVTNFGGKYSPKS